MWKHVVWVVVALSCLAGGYFLGQRREIEKTQSTQFQARCIDVLDGDTAKVIWFMGTNSVRLVGIDAPEVHDNKKLAEQAAQLGMKPEVLLQVGANAKNVLTRMVKDKDVVLTFPESSNKRDSFGRLLAYMAVNNVDVGRYMLKNGLAYKRNEPHPYQALYAEDAQWAIDGKKGVWSWQKK